MNKSLTNHMLTAVHGGQLDTYEIITEWAKMAQDLPIMEKDLCDLLQTVSDTGDGFVDIKTAPPMAEGGAAQPQSVPVRIPAAELVKAKRQEIQDLMANMAKCQDALEDSVGRLMKFDPIASIPMAASADSVAEASIGYIRGQPFKRT